MAARKYFPSDAQSVAAKRIFRLTREQIDAAVSSLLPRYFTRLSWWESSAQLVFAGALILAAAWPLGLLSWQLLLFVGVSINANEIHKMAHRSRAENGWLVSKLQDWRILQTPHQHGLHHSDPKNTYYCPVTNYVNPLLERINFWSHAESLVERVTGATHRHDTAVRGQGPGPDWLVEFRPASRRNCAENCRGYALCQKSRNADSRAA